MSIPKNTTAKKTTAKKGAAKVTAKKVTQQATAKKTTAKKAAAKKTTAKKTTAKKLTAKKAARQDASAVSQPRRHAALAALWLVKTGKQTVGLWVDEHVWTGNDRGECLQLDRETGAVRGSWLLPGECVAVVSDEAWKYAGCANGCVYDLTGSVPRVAYQLGGANHDWLEVNQGVLCVSDDAGTLSVIDVDGSIRWQKADPNAVEAWVLRTAADGLYHGSHVGLRKYDWGGALQWSANPGDVRFGVVSEDAVFVTAGWATNRRKTRLARIDRGTGQVRWQTVIEHGRPGFSHSTGAEAAAVHWGGDGRRRVLAAVGGYLFCYDDEGALEWYAPTGCGSLCNMVAVGETLYFASANGTIGCADLRESSRSAVDNGTWKAPTTRVQARLKARSHAVPTTRKIGRGVVVECVKDGAKLRVRVVSRGYRSDWFCQFPRDIREAGARYIVDEVREASQGGFYRVLGDIKRLA
jgi:hypothetical protein